jgi:DNA-binding NtrC family response regulator
LLTIIQHNGGFPLPTPASVLVFGRDYQLVITRSLILEKAGFHVRTATSVPDIQQLLSEPTMDVMVLCHSLSPQDCDEALLITHQRWPNMQTVALVSGSSSCGSEAADAIMEATEGPAKLINAVRARLN